MCALACAASTAVAQQPSSTKRPGTKADSATADSLALIQELEKVQAAAPSPAAPRAPGAKIAPDISVVGDLVGDLSPDGSTQESGARLGVREVELAIQSVVDPYFRGDVYLGFSDVEGARIEQAYLTTTALPWGLQARLGEREVRAVLEQHVRVTVGQGDEDVDERDLAVRRADRDAAERDAGSHGGKDPGQEP